MVNMNDKPVPEAKSARGGVVVYVIGYLLPGYDVCFQVEMVQVITIDFFGWKRMDECVNLACSNQIRDKLVFDLCAHLFREHRTHQPCLRRTTRREHLPTYTVTRLVYRGSQAGRPSSIT
jgi:hypothetical protein